MRGTVDGAMDVERWAGLHIAFTGSDGSGKSTQAALLHRSLRSAGFYSYLLDRREDFAYEMLYTIALRNGITSPAPYRTYFGREVVSVAFALDYLRDQLRTIQPLKACGRVVVEPRSSFGRLAWAMVAGNSNLAQVEAVLHFGGLPDINIWIDVPVEVCLDRIAKRGIDEEDFDELTRFRSAAQTLAERFDTVRIQGDDTPENVHRAIWEAVQARIRQHSGNLVRVGPE